MYHFDYSRAKTLDEAAKALAASEDAKLIAGGQTLLPTLKQRLAMPTELIDIAKLPELQGIRRDGDKLVIGAGVRHVEVSTSDAVRTAIPGLATLAGMIGDPHVRNRGTIGGSIANNDPGADYPAALVGLGATVRTTKREIAADDFFTGLFETALELGEIVKEIVFPVPKRAAYEKHRNPASRYALVGVFVAETAGGIRVAVIGAGACVFRVPDMEAALARAFAPQSLDGIRLPADDLTSDLHGSAEYRAHLITVVARRAVARAA